jgi:hypothetical protein
MAGRSLDSIGVKRILSKREPRTEPVQGRISSVVSANSQSGCGVLWRILPGVQKEGLYNSHQLSRFD